MTLRHIDSKSRVEKDGIRRRDEFKIGFYNVIRYTYFDNNHKITYRSFSVKADSDTKYMPEICYSDYLWSEKPSFEIQTTSYGVKPPEEIEKIIAGYQHAIDVAKVLTERFCKTKEG